jgi:hypothetical protein
MISAVLLGILVVVFLFLAIGPLESLSWWSEEGADEARETVAEIRSRQQSAGGETPYTGYVVYLSGIGAIGGDSIPPEEAPLIEALRSRLPDHCVIGDVFPYSVANRGLTAQRPLAALWRWVEAARVKNPEAMTGMLVNARNAIQLFVCADRRYGLKALLRNGYQLGSGVPVTLIGWSAGAQIALGASWYLGLAGLPLEVISVGGMMSDDYGLDRIRHLHHLRGSKDPLTRLGEVMFAGRWPKAIGSPWSRALKQGRITVHDIGPMQHNVKDHYFDAHATAPDGRSYLEVTTDAVEAILRGEPVRVIPT